MVGCSLDIQLVYSKPSDLRVVLHNSPSLPINPKLNINIGLSESGEPYPQPETSTPADSRKAVIKTTSYTGISIRVISRAGCVLTYLSRYVKGCKWIEKKAWEDRRVWNGRRETLFSLESVLRIRVRSESWLGGCLIWYRVFEFLLKLGMGFPRNWVVRVFVGLKFYVESCFVGGICVFGWLRVDWGNMLNRNKGIPLVLWLGLVRVVRWRRCVILRNFILSDSVTRRLRQKSQR